MQEVYYSTQMYADLTDLRGYNNIHSADIRLIRVYLRAFSPSAFFAPSAVKYMGES